MNLELFTQTGPGSYYNTNGLSGEELKERQRQVTGQTAEVLQIFANNPQVRFTPWQIWEKTGRRYPITSIRRAITNLEGSDYLTKIEVPVKSGPYGSTSMQWILNPKQLQ